MHKISSHRDLVVWQKAMNLAVDVYKLADYFPNSALYRLTFQITRAAAPVPANIAEGNGRTTTKEYAHFLFFAKCSLMETETILRLAIRLEYVQHADTADTPGLVTEISKMLTTLRYRLVMGRGS